MSIPKSRQRDELLNTVRDASRRAERYCARTRRWDTLLLIISVICGALATLLAGGTVIGGSRALEAVGGWRILCSIVALLTASGTVAGALHKSFQITLIFRARSSASHNLGHLKPPLLPAIYRLKTHCKLSSVSQKSMLLV
jgi:hypothetical protein